MYEYSIIELLGQVLHRMWENITFWKKKKQDNYHYVPLFLRMKPLPKTTSTTIKFRRYERLPTECKPLVEGVTPLLSENGYDGPWPLGTDPFK